MQLCLSIDTFAKVCVVVIFSNLYYENINVGVKNVHTLISTKLLVLLSKRFCILLYRRVKKDYMAISYNNNEILVKDGVCVPRMMILS